MKIVGRITHITAWQCDLVHHLSSFTDDPLDVCQAADCQVLVYDGDTADGASARDLTPEGDGFRLTQGRRHHSLRGAWEHER